MIKGELHLPELIITEGPMPRPRSYHDRRPKITVEYSASTLSRWGFLPAILRDLQRFELPRRLQAITIPSAPNAHFKPVDKLMTLVAVFLTGIARISHIDRTLAGETALARLLGLDRFPSSDTLYHLLGKVTAWHLKQVDRIHRAYLDEQARFDQGTTIADLDLSVKSTEGRKRQGRPPVTAPSIRGGTATSGPWPSPPGWSSGTSCTRAAPRFLGIGIYTAIFAATPWGDGSRRSGT